MSWWSKGWTKTDPCCCACSCAAAMQWSMVVLMSAGLVLAQGHYSIDVVGGLLLAYFVVHTWRCGRLFEPLSRVTGR